MEGDLLKDKKLFVNAILNLIKTISTIVFPLFTFPYVLRVLTPEYMGRVNFASSYVAYFSLVASLGITTYAVRECSAVRGDIKKLEKTASQIFSINICSMVVAYCALFLSLAIFRKTDSYRLIIIIFSSSTFFSIIGADWINSVFEDFRYITIRTIVFQCISLLLLFILVKGPNDYIVYVGITTFSSCGANILNSVYRRNYCKIRLISSFKNMEWKKHFPAISGLFVMLLVQMIFCSTDITILGIMRSDYEVGLYGTAVTIYNYLNQILASFLWVVLPSLSNLFASQNYQEINLLLKKSTQLVIGLGLPCITGCFILSDEIVTAAGGVAYKDASLFLKILMIGLFFSLIGGNIIGNLILIPSKREKYFLQACIVAAIINIVLNLLFVEKYGATAASITTLISHIVIFVMLLPRIDKDIQLGSFKEVGIAPVTGSFAIALICILVKRFIDTVWITLVVAIGISAVVYAFILFLFKFELFIDLWRSVLIKKCRGDMKDE